ncbi:uncharacterized protein LOC112042337 [Lingula anatina]|uniref:Uncharacterized protein LOC112042337 n=1 Tax=Lingula anatina TaxID=7574 RepID=A0A2R2MR90_LINAN|nr:uncharacterized protein LOC112042337 [Lingula anatina]|eukprot:XP_023932527.1 uncharacterized protein LOC112042337 [Lingula anatina]
MKIACFTVPVLILSIGVLDFSKAQQGSIHGIPERFLFKCEGREDGLYADIARNCQVYRICIGGELLTSEAGFDMFPCPQGTLFDQNTLTCQHAANVICPQE